jgi:hypothetical protein
MSFFNKTRTWLRPIEDHNGDCRAHKGPLSSGLHLINGWPTVVRHLMGRRRGVHPGFLPLKAGLFALHNGTRIRSLELKQALQKRSPPQRKCISNGEISKWLPSMQKGRGVHCRPWGLHLHILFFITVRRRPSGWHKAHPQKEHPQ